MEKSDFVRVVSTGAIRVSSKNDNHQNEWDQSKKKKQEHKQNTSSEQGAENPAPELTELIEIGHSIIKKQTAALKPQIVDIGQQTLDNRQENSIAAMPSSIDITTAPTSPNTEHHTPHAEQDDDTDEDILDEDTRTLITPLKKILHLYRVFYQCVVDESKILNIDDIDFLSDYIRQKDDILNQIATTQKDIDFNQIKTLSEKDEKKIKVNQVLSDIHIVMNEIIKQEDENRVELHNVWEKMKLEIARQDKGANAVSKFAITAEKSRFIDTKK